MRIYLVSDCHHEFWDRHKSSKKQIKDWSDKIPSDIDVLVMAGDIDSRTEHLEALLTKIRSLHKHLPIIFVDGNHEHYYHSYEDNKNTIDNICYKLNIHYLDNSGVIINGIKFFGGCGWTNFWDNPYVEILAQEGINDFRVISNFSAETAKTQFNILVSKKELMQADVVITHFSPSELGCDYKYIASPLNGYFHNRLENLIVESNAKLWLHGHIHNKTDYMIGSTNVITNPRGYWGENYRNADEYEGIIVEV